MCAFGLSDCRVKPRRGFTRQPEREKQSEIFGGPGEGGPGDG